MGACCGTPAAGCPGRAVSAVRLRLAGPSDAVPRKEREHRVRSVRVVDVYDGDTVTVLYCAGGRLRRRRCRLAGVDAPELRGPRADPGPAAAARDFLRAATPVRPIRMHVDGTEKYGRWLVRYRLRGGEWAADALIAAGHGVPMDARGRRLPAAPRGGSSTTRNKP